MLYAWLEGRWPSLVDVTVMLGVLCEEITICLFLSFSVFFSVLSASPSMSSCTIEADSASSSGMVRKLSLTGWMPSGLYGFRKLNLSSTYT